MLTPEDEKRLSERMRIIHVLYFAFCAAIIIMTALPLSGALGATPANNGDQIIPVLLGVAVLNLLLAEVIPRYVLKNRSHSGLPSNVNSALSHLFLSTILACVLRESAAILGLISFTLSGNTQWPLLCGGAALAAMILAWPRAESVRSRYHL